MSTRIVATALTSLTLASPCFATSIYQITMSNVAVTQDIVTLKGHPGFLDDLNPFDGGYIFFDEHVRILTEEVNVWDPSQIPGSPDALTCSSGGSTTGPDCSTVDYNVISEGSLTGTWTFDADLLTGIDLGQTGSVAADGSLSGQFLGETSDISTFEVISGGQQVENAVTTSTQVFAANDTVVGVGGEALDLIGIVASLPSDPNVDATGAILLLAGSETWFEEAGGAIPDFTEIATSKFEYDEVGFSVSGDELYRMLIESEIAGHTLSFTSFGAADGTSEDAPLLPDGADLSGDTPSFSFDVSGAGVDFVFVDPEIAVGYTYELVGDGTIDAFQAPTLAAVNDPDGYTVVLPDGTEFTVLPGGIVDFVGAGYGNITTFDLIGISEALMLDPDVTTAFVGGFLFDGTGRGSQLTQTALVREVEVPAVPLPAGFVLMLTGLAGFGLVARRKSVGT